MTSSAKIQTLASSSSLFPIYLKEPSIHVRICPQSSWMLARMGEYFARYYNDVPHTPSRPPVIKTVSAITGIPKSTVHRHIAIKKENLDYIPSCTKKQIRITKREKWEKIAAKYEPFIQV